LLMTLTFTPASVAATGGMSCCPNGSSTHCSSGMGVVAEPPPEPEPQPTCEHESPGEEDVETIVAEAENQDSEQSSLDNSSNHASTPSLKAPCAIDCCSLAWSSFKRPNRDLRGMVPRKAGIHHFTATAKPQMPPVLMVAPERFDKTIPRGPPTR
jgi:hypothetical protein